MIEIIRAREVCGRVHVEEQLVGIAERLDLREGEDTDPHVGVEGDGLQVATVQPPRDRGGTRGSVDGAERLQATPAGALGKKGVIATAGGAGDERAEQRLRNERHVPRDAEHRLGTSGHRRVDPA